MLKEFKEFAMRGNVLDMAVGIIIGAAFGKIVTSFVEDVMMPPLGRLRWARRFLESVHQPLDGTLRHACGSQGGRGPDVELRNISEQRHQLSDRGVRCVSSWCDR